MQSYCKSHRSSYRNSYPFFGGALLHAHDAQVERLLAEPSSRLTTGERACQRPRLLRAGRQKWRAWVARCCSSIGTKEGARRQRAWNMAIGRA